VLSIGTICALFNGSFAEAGAIFAIIACWCIVWAREALSIAFAALFVLACRALGKVFALLADRI